MFTGLVEQTGKVVSKKETEGGFLFKIEAKFLENDLKLGDSIAINGACQTITELENNRTIFSYYSSFKTMELTNFSDLQIGSVVNLERAAKLGDRLGGHIVQGHVDGVGKIIQRKTKDNGKVEVFKIKLKKKESRYVVERGSITIDGISLTVVEIQDTILKVVLIPETIQKTNACFWEKGSLVNIEIEILARYLEKFLDKNR
jgi:riboflavin synthase